jgi:hypothetical protein
LSIATTDASRRDRHLCLDRWTITNPAGRLVTVYNSAATFNLESRSHLVQDREMDETISDEEKVMDVLSGPSNNPALIRCVEMKLYMCVNRY